MVELIIIKAGDDYIRVREDHYQRVALDKASVFPLDKIDLARRHVATLSSSDHADISIKKLILTEEDF